MPSYYIVYSCEINKKEWQDYTFTSEIQVSVQYTKKTKKDWNNILAKLNRINEWLSISKKGNKFSQRKGLVLASEKLDENSFHLLPFFPLIFRQKPKPNNKKKEEKKITTLFSLHFLSSQTLQKKNQHACKEEQNYLSWVVGIYLKLRFCSQNPKLKPDKKSETHNKMVIHGFREWQSNKEVRETRKPPFGSRENPTGRKK